MTGSLHFFAIALKARLQAFEATRASCLRISGSRKAVFSRSCAKFALINGDRNAVIA
jgi:hypothetical protein